MKTNTILKIIVVILVAIFAVYLVYANWFTDSNSPVNNYNTSTESVVCTMEAKLCADGSYVSRTGPKCEFIPCPIVSANPSGPVELVSSSVSFKYPEDLSKYYISIWGGEFAPQVKLLNKKYSCKEGKEVVQGEGETVTSKRLVEGREYCVALKTEGAAGTTFYSYTYTFIKDRKTFVLTFNLAFGGCYYDDPVKTECEKAQDSFNVDIFADQIARSIK